MNAAGRGGALVALLVFSTACTGGSPAAPTPTADAIASRTPVPVGFPAVSQAARLYVDLNSSPRPSRFVLYDDGAFALQYSNILEYRGTYREADAVVTFEWEGWSIAGPWGATASLEDDALTVRYNLIMQLSDFEDGVYLRAQ